MHFYYWIKQRSPQYWTLSFRTVGFNPICILFTRWLVKLVCSTGCLIFVLLHIKRVLFFFSFDLFVIPPVIKAIHQNLWVWFLMAGTSCRNLQVLANYASFKRDENSARSFAYGVTPTAVFFIFPIMYASLSYMSFYRLHCFSNLHMFLAICLCLVGLYRTYLFCPLFLVLSSIRFEYLFCCSVEFFCQSSRP